MDVIADALLQGSTVKQAAELLEPEPDPPLFTPRIALVLRESAHLVAVRRSDSVTDRVVLDAEASPSTVAVISTYSGTPDNPAGTAPVRRAAETRSLVEVAEAIWSALDSSLRVALIAGRSTDSKPVLAFTQDHA